MKNIYNEAMKSVSCLQELLYDDFSGRALTTATIVLDKGACIYKVYGTKIAIMTHSDQFGSTPNQVSWYEVWGTNSDDATITVINQITEDAKSLISEDAYEEIMFFVKAANGNE